LAIENYWSGWRGGVRHVGDVVAFQAGLGTKDGVWLAGLGSRKAGRAEVEAEEKGMEPRGRGEV
jgi:hypothetical protein